ncbi:MAG: hypothetical protein NW220_17555 [Leptolyngbyaceae cyanobacterium bins.349]|nr:hypothetical protein [Leptolyngbyaceae cyanobacterium bins.349]
MSLSAALTTRSLSLSYDQTTIVRDLTLSIPNGKITVSGSPVI